jgi:nucleotide-binding universal stress UspA family protein
MSHHFHHFLVPLDGSAMAESALPVAIGLAKPLGATVTLLHVLERSAPRTIHGERHLQSADQAKAYLDSVAGYWQASLVPIDCHVHPNSIDNVAQSLAEHAAEMRADLIVMTTHGNGGIRELISGSIAQQVLRRGTAPTLVVRPPDDGVAGPYRCTAILVPIDGSHEADDVLDVASEVARATGARIVLATVIPTVSTATGDLAVSATFSPTATAAFLDLAETDAITFLDRVAATLRASGLDVRAIVSRGKTASQLAAISRDQKCDLTILPTHGKSGVEGAVSGSVAPRLLAELRSPILLFRLTHDKGTSAEGRPDIPIEEWT